MQLPAHKCNFLRINATFVENKCNFLTFLLQQKLALVMSQPKCGQWLSLCFPRATCEIRHSSDLALLTNQNGRYFYKTHLATPLVTVIDGRPTLQLD